MSILVKTNTEDEGAVEVRVVRRPNWQQYIYY